MTSPSPTPLAAYLKLQKQQDQQVIAILQSSAASINAEMTALAGKQNIGSIVKNAQLEQSLKAVYEAQAEAFYALELQVLGDTAKAAAAAVEINTAAFESMLIQSGLPPAERANLLRGEIAKAQRNVENSVTHLTTSKQPLSDRVWKTEALVTGHIDKLVSDALAKGTSAKQLAKQVEQFVDPKTPGGARYASQRLARTELNNAFHATQVRHAQESPFVTAMQWHLSGSHPEPDACNDYAEKEHFDGGAAGVYKKADVPAKPHPQCLCYTTAVVMDEDDFLKQFMAGNFDEHLAVGSDPAVAAAEEEAAKKAAKLAEAKAKKAAYEKQHYAKKKAEKAAASEAEKAAAAEAKAAAEAAEKLAAKKAKKAAYEKEYAAKKKAEKAAASKTPALTANQKLAQEYLTKAAGSPVKAAAKTPAKKRR